MYYNFIDHKISDLFKRLVLEMYSEKINVQSIPSPVQTYIAGLYIEKSWASHCRMNQEIRFVENLYKLSQDDTKIVTNFKKVVKTMCMKKTSIMCFSR